MVDSRLHLQKPAACRRCGTCCKKGGPTLREQDRKLVEKGTLPLRILVTIRKGEFVRGVDGEEPFRTESEMIKIKGTGTEWTCALLDAARNRCTQYDSRPIECRAMACWDTSGIERVMKTPALTRRDLIFGVEGLLDLVSNHERRCGLFDLLNLSASIRRDEKEAEREIMEMLRYDKALRDLLVEKGADAEQLEFLLGRPLDSLLGGFDLKLVKDKSRIRIALV